MKKVIIGLLFLSLGNYVFAGNFLIVGQKNNGSFVDVYTALRKNRRRYPYESITTIDMHGIDLSNQANNKLAQDFFRPFENLEYLNLSKTNLFALEDEVLVDMLNSIMYQPEKDRGGVTTGGVVNISHNDIHAYGWEKLFSVLHVLSTKNMKIIVSQKEYNHFPRTVAPLVDALLVKDALEVESGPLVKEKARIRSDSGINVLGGSK